MIFRHLLPACFFLGAAAAVAENPPVANNPERGAASTTWAEKWEGGGDDVWNFLTMMAANEVFHTSLVPSHYDHLSVFNVDASGGIPSVIDNSLVFSQPGRLDLLPALPSALPVESISGILARGQIIIDKLVWDMKAGTLDVQLSSPVEQIVIVALPPGVADPRLFVNGSLGKISDLGAGKTGCGVGLLRSSVTTLSFKFAPQK